MALTITLPDHLTEYIRQQVAEGRFESEDAVIANAVEHLMGEYRWEEDEDLLEAIAEYDRDGGTTVPNVGHYLERLSREARDGAAKGHEVSDDIKY